MEGPELEATLLRLRRIEGQVRGLQRMLSQGDECNDVLTQMMAVRAGLEQVSLVLFDYRVRTPDRPPVDALRRAGSTSTRLGDR